MSNLRQPSRSLTAAVRTPLEEKPANVNTNIPINPKSLLKSRPSTASSAMLANSNNNSMTEESHIKVFVRCRPRNEREVNENSSVVVSTAAEGLHRGKEIAIQSGTGLSTSVTSQAKTYSFDRVFGPESDQQMIFDSGVSNSLKEMVEGYNCTVFAYGQTGTGKTHTMLGEFTVPTESPDLRKLAQIKPEDQWGVIPRTIYELFELFKQDTSKEYSVKLSFIELYNEELRDLLTPDEDTRKVRIYEESGSVTIHGMEEVYISNPLEGLRTLQEGSFRRQVATTKCNDRSSRSHSVFTITVHMKEMALNGEEFVKTGKLNLVDLAGSENIGRSGAQDKRAREAGMINQSLLTLGRVINSLVERSPHIPYRESKLTRVLQDSLGGQTKTCIIATISPARVSLDETLSTLEYASRAKSIKNKPKVNQTMSKQALIKDYIREIERLRSDLVASRNKNGVYMTADSLKLLEDENESRRVLVEEQKLRMEALESQVRRHKKQNEDFESKIEEMTEELVVKKEELADKTAKLETTKVKLDQTIAELDNTKSSLEAETALRKHHQEAELKISKFCDHISSILKQAVDHIDSINQVVSDAFTKEKIHIQTIEALKSKLAKKLTDLEHNVTDTEGALKADINNLIESFSHSTDSSKSQLDQIGATIDEVTKGLENENMTQLRQSLESTFSGFQHVISKLRSIEVDVLSGFKDRLGLLKASTTESISLVVKDIDTLNLTLSQNFERIDTNTSEAFSNLQTSLLEQLSLLDNIKHDFFGKIGSGIEHIASLDDKLHRLMTEQIEKSLVFKNKFVEFATDAHNRQVQELESIVSAMKHEFTTSVNAVESLKDSHTSDLQKLRSALHDHTSKNLDISRASLIKDIKQIGLKHTEEVEEFKETTLQKIDTEISSLVIREVDYVEAEQSQLRNTIALEQSCCNHHQSKANDATESISSSLVKNLQLPINAELEALKNHVLQAHTEQSMLLDALSSSTSGKLSTVAHGLGESGRIVQTITPNDSLTTNATDLKRSRTKSDYLDEISKMDHPKKPKL